MPIHLWRTAAIAAGLVSALAGLVAGQADSLPQLARSRYRDAVAAHKRGDFRAARDFLVQAHEAMPTQPAYLMDAAELSAKIADTAGAVRWLGKLADLGSGVELGRMDEFAAIRDAPALGPVRRRLVENLAPLVRSDSVAGLADPDFYPEGVDYDPGSRSYFVASVRKRTIARIGPGGTELDFAKSGAERLDAVFGVRVDPRNGVLWATTRTLPAMEGYRAGDSTRSRVWAFSLATGKLLAFATAPANEKHWFGDLVVHSSGAVYVSDSESPIVYRARLDGGRVVLDEVVRHALFRSLQGLAFDSTERRLYVADYSHGLLSIDLGTKAVKLVEAPAGVSTLGIDGIARAGNAIIGVQNGISPPRVVRLVLTSDGSRVASLQVLDRHLPIADEPTIGTVVGDRFVYVANSQWEKYDDEGRAKEGAVHRRPVLLAVPLRP